MTENLLQSYHELPVELIKPLARVLSYAPAPSVNSKTLKRESYINVTKYQIAELPPKLLMHDGLIARMCAKALGLCSLHNQLVPSVIEDILRWIQNEVEYYIPRMIRRMRNKGAFSVTQRAIFNTVFAVFEDVPAMWYKSAEFTTRKGRAVAPQWSYQKDRCAACILARLGGDESFVFALRVGMLGRMKESVGDSSRRMKWIEAWMEGVDRKVELQRSSTALGQELKALRKWTNGERLVASPVNEWPSVRQIPPHAPSPPSPSVELKADFDDELSDAEGEEDGRLDPLNRPSSVIDPAFEDRIRKYGYSQVFSNLVTSKNRRDSAASLNQVLESKDQDIVNLIAEYVEYVPSGPSSSPVGSDKSARSRAKEYRMLLGSSMAMFEGADRPIERRSLPRMSHFERGESSAQGAARSSAMHKRDEDDRPWWLRPRTNSTTEENDALEPLGLAITLHSESPESASSRVDTPRHSRASQSSAAAPLAGRVRQVSQHERSPGSAESTQTTFEWVINAARREHGPPPGNWI